MEGKEAIMYLVGLSFVGFVGSMMATVFGNSTLANFIKMMTYLLGFILLASVLSKALGVFNELIKTFFG